MVCAPQKIIYYLLCYNTLFLFYKLLSCCVGRKAVAMRETVVINIKYSNLITENCKIAKGWKTVTGGHFSGVTTKLIHAKNLLLTVESIKTFMNIKRVIQRAVFSTFDWILFSCFFTDHSKPTPIFTKTILDPVSPAKELDSTKLLQSPRTNL